MLVYYTDVSLRTPIILKRVQALSDILPSNKKSKASSPGLAKIPGDCAWAELPVNRTEPCPVTFFKAGKTFSFSPTVMTAAHIQYSRPTTQAVTAVKGLLRSITVIMRQKIYIMQSKIGKTNAAYIPISKESGVRHNLTIFPTSGSA